MPVDMGVSNAEKKGNEGGGSSLQYLRTKLVVGKGAGRAYFLDQTEEGFGPDGQPVKVYRSVKFNTEDLPQFPQIPPDTTIEECQVVIDGENKIIAIGPYNGSYKGKAIDLGPKTPDNTKPMSRIQDKPDKQHPGKTFKDVNFWCIYQITDRDIDGGLWVGATPFMFLKDKFAKRVDDGMTTILGDPSKSNTHAARLREWGGQHDIWGEDIPWPADGNVLPEILARLLAKNVEVLLIFRKGMVQEVQAIRPSGVVRTVAVFHDEDIIEPAKPVSAGAADETFGK